MNLNDRSKTSKKAHADTLMKLVTSLYTGVFVGFFIVPISALVTYYWKSDNISAGNTDVIVILNQFFNWMLIPYIIFFGGAVFVAARFEQHAMDIYDEIEEKPSNGKFKRKDIGNK